MANYRILMTALGGLGLLMSAQAQTNLFSYQGRLLLEGNPVTGWYDLQFSVYESSDSVMPLVGPLSRPGTEIVDGTFTTLLGFGPGVFEGEERWLSISVRTNGTGMYTDLSPRQPILPTPYALHAAQASSVTGGAVVRSLNGLTDQVALSAGQNVTIQPSGNQLTISAAGPGGSGIWSVLNNDTYYNAGRVGIGTTTPANPLTIRTDPTTYGLEVTDGNVRLATFVGGSTEGGWLGTISGHPLSFYTQNSPAIMTIQTNARVGIGISAPVSKLDIAGQDALGLNGYQPFLTFRDSNAGNARTVIQSVNGSMNLLTANFLSGANTLAFVKMDANGHLGVGISQPAARVHIAGSQRALAMTGFNPDVHFYDSGNGYARSVIQSVGGRLNFLTESYMNNSDTRSYASLLNSGEFSVKTLRIRGGADLAEPFEMSTETLEAGSVVVIDDQHPGKLKLSTEAYDTRVAGVISGANGISPGISLQQEGALEGGQNVALTGRVYVRADADPHPIRPGDLLTTADLPGHAMKALEGDRAQGAILGKAMSGLPEGQGLILVLVTLQ